MRDRDIARSFPIANAESLELAPSSRSFAEVTAHVSGPGARRAAH